MDGLDERKSLKQDSISFTATVARNDNVVEQEHQEGQLIKKSLC